MTADKLSVPSLGNQPHHVTGIRILAGFADGPPRAAKKGRLTATAILECHRRKVGSLICNWDISRLALDDPNQADDIEARTGSLPTGSGVGRVHEELGSWVICNGISGLGLDRMRVAAQSRFAL